MRLFIFGLGYSAGFIAADRISDGAQVVATVRSQDKARLKSGGALSMRVFDGDDADSRIAADIAESDAVLVSIPTYAGGDPVLRRWSGALAAATSLRWIGYLSTVGVYGDHGGAWVDESTSVAPLSERSRRRAAAEQDWLAFGRSTAIPVQLFRLAGIYGPGRNSLKRVADGGAQRIVKPGQVFNRIHVADIAQVVAASMARPRAGAIYNVTDDEPAPPQDVLSFAASLLGRAPPPDVPFETADLSPMARSFYAENKRVRNSLLRDELKVRLRYPTYREGLASLHAAGEGV